MGYKAVATENRIVGSSGDVLPNRDFAEKRERSMRGRMARIIECAQGRYEVRETSYGKDYAWCPDCVVIECECGERLTLIPSQFRCRCGADHRSLFQEELDSRRLSEEASRPWDEEYHEWRRKQQEYLLSEETYRLELSTLD